MRTKHVTMPDWAEAFTPHRCDGCGHYHTPAGMDWAKPWVDMYAPIMEQMSRMWGGMAMPGTESWIGAMRPIWQAQKSRHPYGCDCGCEEGDCAGCGRDYCHCRCCIGDADLVVHAHSGERRVVPVAIENSRRRERQIRLELSQWTTRGGKPAQVTAQLMPPAEFTLKPCEEREVILVVEAASTPAPDAGAWVATVAPAGDLNADVAGVAVQAAATDQPRTPDVDDCEVYYADLRIEGCDIRPIRIALALLPRDCASYQVDCRCGCC